MFYPINVHDFILIYSIHFMVTKILTIKELLLVFALISV